MSTDAIMDLCISWGPTILVVVALLSGIIWGLVRGFRKSLILSIQALIAFIACVVIYMIIIGLPTLDKDLVGFGNQMLSTFGMDSIQNLMGVKASNETLTECLIEFIPKQAPDYATAFEIVLKDNGAYLATLVNLAYHIIVALLLYFVYFILVFLLYIIYFIFYPERRYKKKKTKKYKEGLSEKPYKKRKLLGGIIGTTRSLVGCVITLSFLGALFYIIAGGTGDKETPKYDFKDSNMNLAYNAYSSISKYGETGVFKVLNSIKDSNDTPYYLFAADLVLSGGLDDANKDISENIVFREEFATYLGFAENTLNLLLKYDTDGLLADYLKNKNGEITDVLLPIMSKPGFEAEFEKLIDDFDAQTYFVNLSLSLVDSLAENIDKLDVVKDETALTILKIVFVNDGCIKASDLLNPNDARHLAKVAIDILSRQNAEGKLDQTQKTLYYLENVLPELSELGMFNDTIKKNSMNVVMSHLYDYAKDNISFSGDSISLKEYPSDGSYTAELSCIIEETNLGSVDSIDWMGELGKLCTVGGKGAKLYRSVYDPNETDVLLTLDKMFDGEKGAANETDYDSILNTVASSELLDAVLSFDSVYKAIEDGISNISPNFEIPHNISYVDKKKADGTIESHGDVYYVLKSIKALIKNDGLSLLSDYVDKANSMTTSETLDFAKDLSNVLLSDSNVETGESVIDILLNSQLLRYTLTGVLSGLDTGGFELYIPDDVMVVGTTYKDKEYKYISTSEFKNVFNELPEMVDIIKPALKSNDDIDVAKLIKNENLTNVISCSLILEGTVSSVAKDTLKDQEQVIIPQALSEIEAWLSSRNSNGEITSDGEIVKIIKGIQKADLDFDKISNGNFEVNDLKGISEANVKELIKSDVLYYTFSHIISTVELEGAKIIIPTASLDYTAAAYNLADNERIVPIDRNEISGLVTVALRILPEKNQALDLRDVYNSLDEVLDEKVLHATIINLLSTKLENNSDVVIPGIYKTHASEGFLTDSYYASLWVIKEETRHIFDSLDKLLKITSDPNPVEIKSVTNDLSIDTLKLEKDSVDTVLSSTILSATVSKKVVDQEALSVPTNVIDDTYSGINVVENSELTKLLDTAIDLLGTLPTGFNPATDIATGKTEADYYELSINTLTDSNLMDNISIRESMVDELCSSKILAATVSSNVIKNSAIITPLNVTDDATYVGGTATKEIETVELKKTLVAAVKLVGVVPTGKAEAEISVSDLKSLDTDNITITAPKITTITTSTVLSATVSDKLVTNAEIKTPTSVISTAITKKYDNTAITVVEADELDATLSAALALVGTEIDAVLQVKVSELSSLNTDTIILTKTKVDTLCTSAILSATVSDKMITNGELVTPISVVEDINILNVGPTKRINDTELEATLKDTIDLLGTIPVGKIEAEIAVSELSSLDPDTITLTTEGITIICESSILTATVSKKLIEAKDSSDNPTLVVPTESIDTTITQKYDGDAIKVVKATELNKTLTATLELVGTEVDSKLQVQVSELTSLDTDTIVLTNPKVDTLAYSKIMGATISKNILSSSEIKVPQIDIENITTAVSTTEDRIEVNELKQVLKAAIDVLGTGEGVSRSLAVGELSTFDTNEIMLDSTKINEIVGSNILGLTVSDKLTSNASLITPMYVTESKLVYKVASPVRVIKDDDLRHTLNAAVALLGTDGQVKLSELSDLDPDTIVLTAPKIDIITGDNILSATVSKNVVEAKDSLDNPALIIPKNIIATGINKDHQNNNINVVETTELNLVLNAILNLTGTEIDSVLSVNIGSLKTLNTSEIYITSEKIDDITSTEILTATISDKLITSGSLIIPKVSLSSELIANYLDAAINSLTPAVLNSTLNSVLELLGSSSVKVDDVENVNVDEIYLTPAKVTIIVNNDILRATVSDKLYGNDLIVPEAVIDTTIPKDYQNNYIYVIESAELETMFNVTFDLLGSSSEKVADLAALNCDLLEIDAAKVDEICTTHILMASVSDSINKNASFKVPRTSIRVETGYTTNYDGSVTIYIIAASELNVMLKSAIQVMDATSVTVADASHVDMDTLVLNTDKINSITSSEIFTATISAKIISNKANIIINSDLVTSVHDYNVANTLQVLDDVELNKLLNAIVNGLGISVVSSIQAITSADIKIPAQDKREMFAASEIMRATTTHNVASSDYLYVQNNSSYVSTFTDIDSTTRMLFTASEVVNMLNSIEFFTDGDALSVNFDLTTLLAKSADKAKLETSLLSNIIRIKVTSVLSTIYANGLYNKAKVDTMAADGTVINALYEVVNFSAANPTATYSLTEETTAYTFAAPTSVSCYKFGKTGEPGFTTDSVNILGVDDITAFIWAYKAFIAI